MAPQRHTEDFDTWADRINRKANELWVHFPLGQWEWFARIEPQGGHPVIAELRVLPSGGDGWFLNPADNDPPAAPPGGLTARQLRSLKLGDAVPAAYKHLNAMYERGTPPGFSFSPHRFDPRAVAAPRPPGRRGHADSFYAEIAATYIAAAKAGSTHPVTDTRKTFNSIWGSTYKDAYFRDLLGEARRRELLTRPPKGRAGGELTDKGRQALGEGKP